MEPIVIDGQRYAAVRIFTDSRALILYDGLYVLVDRGANGVWDLSGQPASAEEERALRALTDPTDGQTTVVVTKNA